MSGSGKMRQLGELEAVIMDRLWTWGRAALVREVVDDLHRDRPLAYTTVMTVMENLHRKGWLRRGGERPAGGDEAPCSRFRYTPALPKGALGPHADRGADHEQFLHQKTPHHPPS